MAAETKGSESKEVLEESFTLWLSKASIQKLNKLAKSRSTTARLWTKQDVVRDLVEKATR